MEYIPEKWVVIKITTSDVTPIYKVFGCWYDDVWRLNSGITKATLVDNHYELQHYVFEGSSGSNYLCSTALYGTHVYGQNVLNDMIATAAAAGCTIEIMPEETEWEKINYE